MKSLFALVVVTSLSLLSVCRAEEEEPKFSLSLRWTPPGGETVETRMPGIDLLSTSHVTMPFAREGAGDPNWFAEIDFDFGDQSVSVSLADVSRLEPVKDGAPRPLVWFEATFPLVWNQETVAFESPTGTFRFVPGLEGTPPVYGSGAASKLPDDLAKQIDFTCEVDVKRGNLSFEVYNPTEHQVSSIRVRVEVPATGDLPALNRVYEGNVDWPPFRDARNGDGMHLPKLMEYPEGTPVKVTLEEVE